MADQLMETWLKDPQDPPRPPKIKKKNFFWKKTEKDPQDPPKGPPKLKKKIFWKKRKKTFNWPIVSPSDWYWPQVTGFDLDWLVSTQTDKTGYLKGSA